MTTNYFDYFRENTETVDDVLAFLNKYMSNVYPDKEVKVKIGSSVCTDMIGNIYLTIDTICEYLDKSDTVKDASLRLLANVLHEFMHWVETDKNAWDNGVNKHKNPKDQQLMQYIINCLEDGRGEASFMNRFYGSIYPLLYSNNFIDKQMEGKQFNGLEAILFNIIGLSVNYRVRQFDLDEKFQKLQDDIVALMQSKSIWSLPSTDSVVEVADEIFQMIKETTSEDNEDEQDGQSSKEDGQEDGDNESNGSDGSGSGDGEGEGSDGDSDGQSGDSNSDGQTKQSSNSSNGQPLDDVDFDKLKELFNNYKDESPGREKGFQKQENHDDYIDFSNIVNDLDVTPDDIHIPELDALSEKYDKPQQEVEYTKEKAKSSNSYSSTTTDNNMPITIPDLTQLDDQISSHKDISMKIILPKVRLLERELYEKNKFSLDTDIEELVFLLRSVLKRKVENDTEEVIFSGSLDNDKLLNIALEKYDIFENISSFSDNLDNSIFISVDLSGSMMPRQKHIMKSLILLHEVLKSLKLKHAIWGFNTSGKEVHHHPFVTFDNCDDDEVSYNLGALNTYGENRDGYSVRFFEHYIQEKGKRPLYITMTDGNPNHWSYSGASAIKDTKTALEQMGLPTIAFCIGDRENMNIQSIYDNSIECEEVHELPEMLHDFLLDVVN